jgi:hypothetical protein
MQLRKGKIRLGPETSDNKVLVGERGLLYVYVDCEITPMRAKSFLLIRPWYWVK